MKKIIGLLFIALGAVVLLACDKTPSMNLPAFKATDSQEYIGKELTKRNINHYFEYEATEDNSVDGQFVKYGNDLVAGTTIDDNRTVVVFMYKFVLRELMFTKYVHSDNGSNIRNNMLEIYNPTDASVDLSNYRVMIYMDGSNRAGKTIRLEGTLTSKQSYKIVNPRSETILLDSANLKTADLIFDGNEAITITNNDNMVLDILGFKGRDLMSLNQKIVIRNSNITKGVENYNPLDWTDYHKTYNEIISKDFPIEVPTNFTYLEADKALPYEQKRGMIKVEFISNNDGDTAQFKVIENQTLDGNPIPTDFFMGDGRIRFLGVDTREMSSAPGSKDLELAILATDFVRGVLGTAKDVYIQHDPQGRVENYGRNLALIWADGKLVNYLIVKEGHSVATYKEVENDAFIYEGISLANWFKMAEQEAKDAKLNVWA